MTAADRLDAIEARIDAAMADAWIDTPDDVSALVAALRGVMAEHPTTELRVEGEPFETCMVCLTIYPCPTVAAITAALGVTR